MILKDGLIGNALLGKLRKMRTIGDDEDDAPASGATKQGSSTQQPAWMKSLLQQCQLWLRSLPEVRGPSIRFPIEHNADNLLRYNSASARPKCARIAMILSSASLLARQVWAARCWQKYGSILRM